MVPARLSFVFMLFIFFTMSCAGLQSKGNPVTSGPDVDADGARQYEELNFYYDFEDVLVPRELKLDPNDSFVFETPQFKTGILKFNGRVDSFSLVDYFNTNLAKDGWKKHSSYKAKKSILVYDKQGKSCFISVLDESFSNTRVEILVVEMK